jgi:hypothetical protein
VASVNYQIVTTGLKEMVEQFGSLAKPPGFKAIGRFEKEFALCYAAVQDGVHEITGYLKSSGVPRTHYDGNTWEGEIEFDAHPGIFELWRGNTPTANHPEGGHGFFDKVEPFLANFERHVDEFFEDAFKQGPI